MRNFFRIMLTTTVLAIIFPAQAFAESYTVTSTEGTALIKIKLQGGGAFVFNDKTLATAGLSGNVVQVLNLHADHTLTGYIGAKTPSTTDTLFALSGTWYRPPGSSTIYFGLDGDPTKGPDSDGAFGALFAPPPKAAVMELQGFMPILFGTKVSSIQPIYPTVAMKQGVIKLKLSGDQIKSATTTMEVAGRTMANFCKMDKAEPPACSIPNGTKDVAFGFSATSKSTVEATP